MPDNLQVVPEPQAQLNVTYNGQNGDYPDPISFDLTEGDIKQIVSEAIQTGYIPGIDPVENPDIGDFVVDRFNATDDLPQRLMVRPKTPFGVDLKAEIYLFLESKGCKLSEAAGIVTITDPEGGVWDMTIPQKVG